MIRAGPAYGNRGSSAALPESGSQAGGARQVRRKEYAERS